MLLVVAVLFMPVSCSTERSIFTESPQTVCGDSVSPHDTLDDCEDENSDYSKIITVVVIVIIIIVIFYFFSNLSNKT